MATKETEWQNKYDAENCRRISLRFTYTSDADIIGKLEAIKSSGGSVAGYIKKALHDYLEVKP